MNNGFPSLSGAQEELEEGFWSSFSNVMMVILKIFLLVIVVMALNSRNLLEDLKHSIRAKEAAQEEAKQAAQLAQSSLKANATLEEQLSYYQQRSSDLEMELLRSRAETEDARDAKINQEAELSRLKETAAAQSEQLGLRDTILKDMQTQMASKDAELGSLRSKVDESEKKLLSLQGDYTDLDQKYQKLLKPARSAKGKQVVEVMFSKAGYTIRKPGEPMARSIPRAQLDSELGGLKTQYGTDLYVKVIIPDNSGLSYNEAWRFTNDMLSQYDYYYQPDNSKPAPAP
jgi:hypothetical protein